MYFFHLSFLGHIFKYLNPSYYCPLDFFQFSTSPFNCGAPQWMQYSRRVISLLLCYIHITFVIIHLRRKFILFEMASHHWVTGFMTWPFCAVQLSVELVNSSSFSPLFLHLIFPFDGNTLYLNFQISCWLGLSVQLSRPFVILMLPFKGVEASFNLWSFAESKWVLLVGNQKVRTEMVLQKGLGNWLKFIKVGELWGFFHNSLKQLLVVVFFHF